MTSNSSIFRGPPEQWAKVVDAVSAEGMVWDPNELKAIWRHQLSAPVEFGGTAESGLSFGGLLFQPQPSRALLRQTKDFAKANTRPPQHWLPREMAAVLYYCSIAAALARLRQRISTLSDDQLRKGFVWAHDHDWLDDQTRQLLKDAISLLPQLPEPKTGI